MHTLNDPYPHCTRRTLRTAKRIPEPSCLRRSPSGQRAWWGEDGAESCEAATWHRSDPEELLSLCRTAWQIETSNVTLG